uniref:Histone H1.2-like n=1 Tax=Rhizophora mucronata TaxID=61149 RepID=A0A2P2MZ26_RHIMU
MADAAVATHAPAGATTKPKVLKARKPAGAGAKKPRSPRAYPPFYEMVSVAIVSLKERTGSSQYAITKFIEERHKDLPANFRKFLLLQLKRLVASGKLVKVKNSFKLPAVKKASGSKSKVEAKPKAEAKAPVAKVRSSAKPKPKAKANATGRPKPKVVTKPAKAVKTATATSPGKKAAPVKSVKRPKTLKSPAKKKATAKKAKK